MERSRPGRGTVLDQLREEIYCLARLAEALLGSRPLLVGFPGLVPLAFVGEPSLLLLAEYQDGTRREDHHRNEQHQDAHADQRLVPPRPLLATLQQRRPPGTNRLVFQKAAEVFRQLAGGGV